MSDSTARGEGIYNKPALTENELLDRWQKRGMVVPDLGRASRYLRHVGYYRLSAYVRSFEGGERDVLRPGTTFDDVLDLYIFDRKLRLLSLDALERIEVSVRAAISDHMSRAAGPHWYEDPTFFARADTYREFLRRVDHLVDEQLRRPREQGPNDDNFVSALEHYVTHYASPPRPPSWLVFEELTLGSVRTVYSGLRDRRIQSAVASSLGLQPPVLGSWLLSYQRVRNICAHHGRLWNRGIGVYPALPKSARIPWLKDRDLFARDPWRRQRLYPVLVSIQSVLHTVAPGSTWGQRVHDLLVDHPEVPLRPMGIPENWFDDPFWPRRNHE